METHVRNVGRALLIFGIFFAVISASVLYAFGGVDGVLMTDDPFYKRKDIGSIPVGRLVGVFYLVVSLALSVPMAVTGWGLLRFQPWAKTMGLLVSAVILLHFPIGTGIGVYSLWVLTDEATEFLFANAPAGGARR